MPRLKSLRFPSVMLFGAGILLANPTLAGAAQKLNLPATTTPQPVEFPSMLWLFIKMVFSLIIIVGLAYIMVRVLKKNMQPPSAGDWFNIVDQYALGPNKGVYLTEIGGKAYLLGVTDHNINILGEFNEPERLDEIKKQVEAREQLPPVAQNFLNQIANYLNKKFTKNNTDFHSHILKQIQRLQTISKDSTESTGKKEDRHV